MNPLAIIVGGAAGWWVAGLLDKQPLFRSVIAFSGAYAANAFANAGPAQAAPAALPPRAVPTSSAPAGSSDTLSSGNLATATGTSDSAGGGGSDF